MRPYEFIENTALSDTAFYAYGRDFGELIKNACLAVTDAMVEADRIEPKLTEQITVRGASPEHLLYNILEEMIFLKDAKQMVFKSVEAKTLSLDPPNCQADLVMRGEKIDREKHRAHGDVKAVTMKNFNIEEAKNGYRASVVLDV